MILADVIEAMALAGCTPRQMADVAASLQAQKRSSAAIRQARYRRNKALRASQNVTIITRDSPPNEMSPIPPKNITPCSESSLRSDSAAPSAALDEDPKAILFNDGLSWLAKETGKPEASVRPLVGRMLRDVGGDAHAAILLGIFRDCKRERKADPISWIQSMVEGRRPRAGPAGRSNGNSGLAKWVYDGLEDDERRSEKSAPEAVPMLPFKR